MFKSAHIIRSSVGVRGGDAGREERGKERAFRTIKRRRKFTEPRNQTKRGRMFDRVVELFVLRVHSYFSNRSPGETTRAAWGLRMGPGAVATEHTCFVNRFARRFFFAFVRAKGELLLETLTDYQAVGYTEKITGSKRINNVATDNVALRCNRIPIRTSKQ